MVVYHAGLTREERTEAQDRFMSGQAQVVVATNAFGMGVDKSDIRSVIHFNLPGTLEAYYQEAGRAGRDGHPAHCLLLYAAGDRFLQEMFIENEYPPPDSVFRVYEFLRGLDADPIELTHAEIKESARLDLNESAVGTALKILEGAGAIERFRPRENMAIVRINAEGDEPSLVERINPNAHVQQVVLRGVEGLVNAGRYGESVYFQPDDFAARLGLDRTSLTRALKNLAGELPIDYVPPFRGNAVRVNDRSRRPRDLVIDFQELESRKRREYDKLERMIKYAQSPHCRRSFILGYFGDHDASECGRCDNCGPMEGRAQTPIHPIDNEAGREIVLKVLSGVARGRGKYGKVAIAQMLIGSRSEKMTKLSLNRLSTFGILAEFAQSEVATLVDALALAGLVESKDVDRFRPVVDVTEAGRDYLKAKGDLPLQLALPVEIATKVRFGGLRSDTTPRADPETGRRVSKQESRQGSAESTETGEPPSPDVSGDPLYLKLKTMRAQWAREANQSAYTIFPNKTLEALVLSRPQSPHELASIKGVGPVIRERYGAALLAAIAGTSGTTGSQAAPWSRLGRSRSPSRRGRIRQRRQATRRRSGRAVGRPEAHLKFPGQDLRPDRGVDLATARPRVHPRGSGGDPGPRTLGGRETCHLDGQERAPDPPRSVHPLGHFEGLGRSPRTRGSRLPGRPRRPGRTLVAVPGLPVGAFLITRERSRCQIDRTSPKPTPCIAWRSGEATARRRMRLPRQASTSGSSASLITPTTRGATSITCRSAGAGSSPG